MSSPFSETRERQLARLGGAKPTTANAARAISKGSLAEPVSPHGLRASFVTTAYRNGVPDEEIMGHTRHPPSHKSCRPCEKSSLVGPANICRQQGA